MVTRPPARAISLAISAPELPTPTTSTRCATYGSGRLYPTLSPRSSTRWGTPRARSCCEAARPAGPAPTTMTGVRSGIGSDGFRDAIRERHDRDVGIDLERIGEEARVGDAEPRDAVYAAPGVGDGVGRAPPHGAAAHEMRGRQRHGPRPEVSRRDALLDPARLGGVDQRRA